MATHDTDPMAELLNRESFANLSTSMSASTVGPEWEVDYGDAWDSAPNGEMVEDETAQQRDAFRATADALGQEVVKLKEQADAYANRLAEAERVGTEARTQWAARLEQAQREFSEEMLSREDLEAMRLLLVEQTEAPWKARVKALEADAIANVSFDLASREPGEGEAPPKSKEDFSRLVASLGGSTADYAKPRKSPVPLP